RRDQQGFASVAGAKRPVEGGKPTPPTHIGWTGNTAIVTKLQAREAVLAIESKVSSRHLTLLIMPEFARVSALNYEKFPISPDELRPTSCCVLGIPGIIVEVACWSPGFSRRLGTEPVQSNRLKPGLQQKLLNLTVNGTSPVPGSCGTCRSWNRMLLPV